MTQLMTELEATRETVAKLLDELQLVAYLFEVEPQDDQWQLTVECAIEEGWETVKLKAKKDYFQHGANDTLLHKLLLDEWREALSACNVSKSIKK